MNQPAREQRFEIEVSGDVEAGVHADFASIWHTQDTFVLDFASLRRPPYLTEDADAGRQVAVMPVRVVARVKIPPGQVFELMKALEAQLSAWETDTGRRPGGGPSGPASPG